MPPPAFAKMRRGEQAVDEFLDCRLPIFDCGFLEGFDLLNGGRQTGEIIIKAADQNGGSGIAGGLQFLRLHAREHEAVQRIARPIGLLHLGRLRFADGLKGPEGFIGNGGGFGPGSAEFFPLLEIADDRFRHGLVRWMRVNRAKNTDNALRLYGRDRLIESNLLCLFR